MRGMLSRALGEAANGFSEKLLRLTQFTLPQPTHTTTARHRLQGGRGSTQEQVPGVPNALKCTEEGRGAEEAENTTKKESAKDDDGGIRLAPGRVAASS